MPNLGLTYRIPANNNIESALKQHWSSMFMNVVSTLKFGWKWKLNRGMFIDVASTLTKQRWNNTEKIMSIQQRCSNNIWLKTNVEQRMFIGVAQLWEKSIESNLSIFAYWCSWESGLITKQN